MTSLFYIRYLKPPPTIVNPGKPFTIAWTVTNDLGEISYWQPLTVKCRLACGIATSPVQLQLTSPSPPPSAKNNTNQKDTVQLVYDPVRGGGTMISSLIVTGSATRPNVAIQLVLELASGEPHSLWAGSRRLADDWIIPVWSLPFQLSAKASGSSATHEYERQVSLGNQTIKIHEDVSPSMGSHLWDCGLLMCQYLAENRLPRYTTVIELGSGTGIAGIYYAHLLKPSKMYLTDLADTVPTIKHNFALQKPPKGVQPMPPMAPSSLHFKG
ncbi:putative methyltransferase-domain-containing protein [Fennellomyces sp. T-0311]|nr:putative methyltransferase-domain-containing protein [Fennellomyces sp. T-0311]